MARTYLVAFDASAGARDALAWTLRAAAHDGSRVRAVAVWSVPVTAVSPWVPAPSFDEPALARAFRDHLERAVEQLRTEVPVDVDLSLEVVVGVPGPTLVELAAGADCLVVGRRGHGGFAGLLLGSVADHCLHHATVPLALVPPAGVETTGAVVAGVDGSPHAAAALRWAAGEATRRQRPLVAVYAWSWLVQPGDFDPGFDAAAAKRFATGAVAEAIGEQPCDVLAVNDLPVRVLLDHSAAGDLVVVGSRGAGPLREVVVGSVSRQLAHHAAGTVVVIRPQA